MNELMRVLTIQKAAEIYQTEGIGFVVDNGGQVVTLIFDEMGCGSETTQI